MRPADLAEHVLRLSPADRTMVVVTAASSVDTRWARNELTTNGHASTLDIAVIAIHDSADGPRTATLERPAYALDVAAFVQQAAQMARENPPAPDAFALPVPNATLIGEPWDAPTAETSPADLSSTLTALAEELARDAAEFREHFGYVQASTLVQWVITSTGLTGRSTLPQARLEMTVKSHGRSRSTWHGYAGEDLAGADVELLARQARNALELQANVLAVPPGRRRVVLSPSATADMMIDLLMGADGLAAAEGRSAFSAPGGGTRLGERLSGRPIRLSSDPMLSGHRGAPFLLTTMSSDAASVFDNGLGLGPCDWIRDGELSALVGSRAAAAQTGLTLALAPDTLTLDAAGTGDVADLVSRVDEGLLITCTWYNRMVDPAEHLITGLTRDGVYVISGGEIVGHAGNFRFNDSPVGLLDRIVDASAPQSALGREMADWFTRTTMPALLVDGFELSSASEAV